MFRTIEAPLSPETPLQGFSKEMIASTNYDVMESSRRLRAVSLPPTWSEFTFIDLSDNIEAYNLNDSR